MIKKWNEIARLKKELEEVSGGRVSSEYQTENYESSWRTSIGSEYMRGEESSGSFSSRRHKHMMEVDESSDDEDYYKERKSSHTCLT